MYTTEHYQHLSKDQSEAQRTKNLDSPAPTPSQGLDDRPKIIVNIAKVRK